MLFLIKERVHEEGMVDPWRISVGERTKSSKTHGPKNEPLECQTASLRRYSASQLPLRSQCASHSQNSHLSHSLLPLALSVNAPE